MNPVVVESWAACDSCIKCGTCGACGACVACTILPIFLVYGAAASAMVGGMATTLLAKL